MRRRDREITDPDMIEKFIAGEKLLRIAFYDNGDIYIVPVNYGYIYENDKFVFYFHGASDGRKYKLSQSNPMVGFEIDGKYKLLENDAACEFSAEFQSVIGSGRLKLLTDRQEKITGLNAVMKQVSGRDEWSYDRKMVDNAAVYKLEVQKLTCKAKL